MQCPTCKTVNLNMVFRDDIEIDYCPDCRGVWLDKGELDKLIQKAVANQGPQNINFQHNSTNQNMNQVNHQNSNPQSHESRRYDHTNHNSKSYDPKHYDTNYGHHKKKKKEGWFEDLFDF